MTNSAAMITALVQAWALPALALAAGLALLAWVRRVPIPSLHVRPDGEPAARGGEILVRT